MSDLIRDAPLGQVVRWASGNRMFQYDEEKSGYALPAEYTKHCQSDSSTPDDSEPVAELKPARTRESLRADLSRVRSRADLEKVESRADLEAAYTNATIKQTKSEAIQPEKLDDGTILVDWYATDDPNNPQNWSSRKKIFVVATIDIYTLAVYLGSAIITPAIPEMSAKFNVSPLVGSLIGLSSYVLGYGVGPLLFSPLSEIPRIGRNPPYIISFAIFLLLSVGSALVNNAGGMFVLRFFQGFFGSPCLATAGASFGDIYSLINLPYAILPVLGWRISLWEILWLAGPVWILLFIALPETSAANILLRKAERLRKITGNPNFRSQSEIEQENMSPRQIVYEALVRPFQLMVLDPSIAFVTIYTALVYGIYYSFFEAFPLVYERFYHFNAGQMGLTFLSITVGVAIAIPVYAGNLYWRVNPDLVKNGLGEPESRLVPALYSSILLPIGLFIFGWTSREDIPWIASVIGVTINTIGVFILLQSIFIYLPLSYPQYAASLFAGNDFARSSLAAGTILFATPMYKNLGIGPGISILAGLTCACVGGIFVLYLFGKKLRARSRFTVK
ncbi:MAG: hypothetical protein M1814_000228 [Vezdaea aestivalis]|nr:MAG: hypothetical protein M1814_000228 [Vezdaea aestivalis]